MKKPFLKSEKETVPSRLILCVLLAGRDHTAGVFLSSIVHWIQYASAEIPGENGNWIANVRAWWMQECCLTPSKYDRTISKLHGMGLIERRQWWWGGKCVLFVRPSKATTDYLAMAKSWKAALELPVTFGIAENDELSSAKSTIPNGIVDIDELGSLEMQNPKYINNLHDKTEHILPTGALTASPSCSEEKQVYKKGYHGEKKNKLVALFGQETQQGSTISDLRYLWEKTIADEYSNEIDSGAMLSKLSAKEVGLLAEWEACLASVSNGDLVADLRPWAKDIISFAIKQWPHVGSAYMKSPYPSVFFLTDSLGIITAWVNADCPSFPVWAAAKTT